MNIFKRIIPVFIMAVLSLLIAGVLVVDRLAVPVITADFNSQSELSGRASGFLYGFAEEDIPTEEIARSIGINSLATKTYGGLQHPIGDVKDVSGTFLSAGGEMLMVYTQDMYDTWYYQLDSFSEYNEKVKYTVSEIEKSAYRDKIVYCIYNEMDNGVWCGNFWEEENRKEFYSQWKITYDVVKEINPDAKIAGPGHCGYNYDFIKEFLIYCKENDCLPEVIVWHELSDQSIYWMEHNFQGYYSICDEIGIERLPVCISEYGLMRTNGIPGESVKWISRLEAEDAYGCVAYWRLANNLSDTVADDVTPNSNYWVYNFYGKMKGNELETKEWDMLHSNIGNYLKGKYPLMNKGFIATVSYDEAEEKFYVLAGGGDKASRVEIINLENSGFNDGDVLTVKISSVDYKGLGGAVIAPEICEVKNAVVTDNELKFTIPCERETQAFFVEITRGKSEEFKNDGIVLRYEAEEALLSGEAYPTDAVAYSVSKGNCVKGINEGSEVTFSVNVPEEAQYKLDIIYGNASTGEDGRKSADITVSCNGNNYTVRAHSSVKEDCMECVSCILPLKAGDNEISVGVKDGSITLDFIDISSDITEKTYVSVLSSRNTEAENAYSVVTSSDGHYKFSELKDDSTIIINGESITGDGDGIFYLSRGYNEIILNEGNSFTAVEKVSMKNYYEPTFDVVSFIGGATNEEDKNSSSGMRAGWISSETGSGIEFAFIADEEGVYAFTVEYSNNEEGGYHDYNVDLIERYISVYVDGIKDKNVFFRSTYSWDNYKTKTFNLYLTEGEHVIAFSNDGSYSFNNMTTYAPNIGSVMINKVK